MNGESISSIQAGGYPAAGADGRARRAALAAGRGAMTGATSVVDYVSRGRCLVIGPRGRALRAAGTLGARLQCLVLVPPEDKAGATPPAGVKLVTGALASLVGHLGAFAATVTASGTEQNLAQLLDSHHEVFDLVLDLGAAPALARDVLPPGYFAPGDDDAALQDALEQLPDLVGEFEKPKFFHYDAQICAHGNSGLSGCTRCLQVCPTEAITSLVDRIEVDPHLCQGLGSCATACPTGAISYAYPSVDDLLGDARALLRRYRHEGGQQACVLIHDADTGAALVAAAAAAMPERVLPFPVAELGSVGLETWLALLAYGAGQVTLLAHDDIPARVLGEVRRQLGYAHELLSGMGYARAHLQCLEADTGTQLAERLAEIPHTPDAEPASFAAFGGKREVLRLALEHLHARAARPAAVVALSAGAPFGAVAVNQAACTLCMACVSVCPAKALLDGQDRPQLRLREANCVQCGLCEKACPEGAVSLEPRMAFAEYFGREARVVHEEEPFECVSCGKPFATHKMMERMAEKLAGHWMFQDEKARRRLQMCEDCRVKDVLSEAGGLNVYDKT